MTQRDEATAGKSFVVAANSAIAIASKHGDVLKLSGEKAQERKQGNKSRLSTHRLHRRHRYFPCRAGDREFCDDGACDDNDGSDFYEYAF